MQLRQAELTWHVAGDDVVVLDLEGSVYLKLNGSGTRAVGASGRACTESELPALLVERTASTRSGRPPTWRRSSPICAPRGLLVE